MKREFLKTDDGSVTIHLPDWNEQYHSKHGALAEAKHVFIESGLRYFTERHAKSTLNILEIGFGTGLNALLTSLEATQLNRQIRYQGVEAFPVSMEEVYALNYAELVGRPKSELIGLHETPWEQWAQINECFTLLKSKQFFKDIDAQAAYDIIYFDAFGARVQPELWTEAIFRIMHKALKINGVLVTYSSKGSVRRAMQEIGFTVERLEGPPGKRHMLRAIKAHQ